MRSVRAIKVTGVRSDDLCGNALLDALLKMRHGLHKENLDKIRTVLGHKEDIFLKISQGIKIKFDNTKINTIHEHQNSYDELLKHILCYFPANRFELPNWSQLAWQNCVPLTKIQYKDIHLPIYIESSIDDTIQWIKIQKIYTIIFLEL